MGGEGSGAVSSAMPLGNHHMGIMRKLFDRSGFAWTVEHRESDRLSTIGGYLMTNDGEGCLTLSSRLSDQDRSRGREKLTDDLVQERIPRRGVRLWRPSDSD
jgi:hypothetical protein